MFEPIQVAKSEEPHSSILIPWYFWFFSKCEFYEVRWKWHRNDCMHKEFTTISWCLVCTASTWISIPETKPGRALRRLFQGNGSAEDPDVKASPFLWQTYVRTSVSLFILGFCGFPRAIPKNLRAIPKIIGACWKGQELFLKILGNPQSYS